MSNEWIKYKRLVFLMIYMLPLAYISAEKVTVDGLNYYLYLDTHEAIIDNGNTWVGELVIPSEIIYNGQKYTVKGICWNAFYNCNELTKIKIPKTVDSVIHHVLSDEGPGAVSSDCMNPFKGCTALESVEVDESNPVMKSVGGVLFSKEGTGLYSYPAGIKAEKYVVPEGVTWLGISAFANSVNLVSLELPESVTKLGAEVFSDCQKLKTISLPRNLSHLESATFRNCSSLESVKIPTGVRTIGEQTFFGCISLKIIDLTERMEAIGSLAFYACSLDTLIIRGILDSQSVNKNLFVGLNESTKLFVPASEIGRYENIYAGPILPLENIITSLPSLLYSSDKSKNVYVLSGRRLQKAPQKGLYIQDGKKVVIK